MFFNSDLTVLEHWHSCDITQGNTFFLHSEPFYMKGLYPNHILPRF